MNTLMIPIERISQKLKMQTDETPTWLKGGHFPWITLAISIALMLFSKRFLHIDLPILSVWIVISVLVTLRYKPYVFHNLICPFGALQKTLGRFSLLSHRVEKDACIGCKLCENACSASAIAVSSEDRKAEIRTALCHQCSNCIRVCPKAAIHYRRE
jgi:ferredoxin-type protein NapH